MSTIITGVIHPDPVEKLLILKANSNAFLLLQLSDWNQLSLF